MEESHITLTNFWCKCDQPSSIIAVSSDDCECGVYHEIHHHCIDCGGLVNLEYDDGFVECDQSELS